MPKKDNVTNAHHFRSRMLATLALLIGVGMLSGLLVWFFSTKKKTELNLSAGQPGGVYLPFARELATLIEAENPKLTVNVLESAGSVENAQRLHDGEVELGLVQNDVLPVESVSTVCPMFSGALHIVAPSESEIQSVTDLRGKKVGIGLRHSGSSRVVEALLRHYEIENQVEVSPLEIQDAFKKLKTGEVNALLLMLGIGSEAIEKAAHLDSLRLIPIGKSIGPESELEAFRLNYPFADRMWIPRSAYRPNFPENPVPAVSIRTFLVTRTDFSPNVIRKITETIERNRARLAVHYAPVGKIVQAPLDDNLQFPVHRGAEEYYHRNDPGFLVQYAEVIGVGFSLLVAFVGFVATMRSWIHQRQKDRIDDFYLELNQISEELDDTKKIGPARLDELENDLRTMQKSAVRQLAEERLLPDESFRIFQKLLADCHNQIQQIREDEA